MATTATKGTVYYVGQTDRKPDLVMVVKDIDGPVDLTASTAINVYVDFPSGRKTYAATKDPDQVTNKGKLSYQFGTDDVPDAGEHRMQTVVSFGLNITETFPNNTYDFLHVVERIV